MHIKTQRTCIVCKEKKIQNEMIRLSYINSEIEISDTKKGRGAYICKNEQCVNNLIKSKSLSRTFKFNVNLNVYQNIQEQLIEKLKNKNIF